MPRNSSQEHSALIPSDAVACDLSTDKKAQKAQSNIGLKYKHADPTNVWRHENKIGVLIRCAVPGCEKQRFVHSSDLFQVKDCGTHDEPKARKPKDAPKARVRSNGGTRAGRKAPRGRKGNGKARKARRGAAASV